MMSFSKSQMIFMFLISTASWAKPANQGDVNWLAGTWQRGPTWDAYYDSFTFDLNSMSVTNRVWMGFDLPETGQVYPCFIEDVGSVSSIENEQISNYYGINGDEFVIRFSYNRHSLISSPENHTRCAEAADLAGDRARSDTIRIIRDSQGQAYREREGAISPVPVRKF